jgi:hypothetical protein
MKKALVIRPDAERDLAEAYGWYEERVPGLGSDFLLSIDAALSSIQRTPKMYRIQKCPQGPCSPFSLWDILCGRGGQDCGPRNPACPERSQDLAGSSVTKFFHEKIGRAEGYVDAEIAYRFLRQRMKGFVGVTDSDWGIILICPISMMINREGSRFFS